MEIQSMLPGYLDVVFHNRNKAYGGYELRVHYAERIRKAALYAFAVTGLLCTWAILTNREVKKLIHVKEAPPTVITEIAPLLPPPPVHPPTHTVQPTGGIAPAQVHTQTRTVPVLVVDNTPDEQLLRSIEPTAQPSSTTSSGNDVPTGSTAGNGDANGTDNNNNLGGVSGPVSIDKPMLVADVMPEFNGDMSKYLSKNMNYPEAARQAGTHGRVVIQFVVNEDGSISAAQVLKGIGDGCDAEALRVVKHMPRWKPGRQNGRAVKVYFSLPVWFVLQ